VLTFPPAVKVFVATQPIDGRKGAYSLAAMVRSVFSHDPFVGVVDEAESELGLDPAQRLRWWTLALEMRHALHQLGVEVTQPRDQRHHRQDELKEAPLGDHLLHPRPHALDVRLVDAGDRLGLRWLPVRKCSPWPVVPKSLATVSGRSKEPKPRGSKGGVRALHAPVNTLNANWAYMVMASLAWTLKAWMSLPICPRWRAKHRAERDAWLRMAPSPSGHQHPRPGGDDRQEVRHPAARLPAPAPRPHAPRRRHIALAPPRWHGGHAGGTNATARRAAPATCAPLPSRHAGFLRERLIEV